MSSESADGAASAAPMPCTTRAASSIQPATARPPTSELTEKIAIPARNVVRRPSRSPARAPNRRSPPKASRYPFSTQESAPFENPRPRWMWGSATLTIVVSSTTIIWAARMTRRKIEGRASTLRSRSFPWMGASPSVRGRVGLRVGAGIDFDLSAGILKSGSFLRLVYGGSLRLASRYLSGRCEACGESPGCRGNGG